MTHYEIEKLWISEGLNVAYRFGDVVRLKAGDRQGETGIVIALFKLEPVPTYMVELPDGKSQVAPEPELESTGANSGRILILHKDGDDIAGRPNR